MAEFALQNVGVEFPLYETSGRSLKKVALRTAVGGLIGKSPRHSHTIVSALSDITLSLREGDRLGVVGANGSGKTTLLRVLAGIYHPTSGRMTRTGTCVPLLDLGRGTDDDATGRENILLRGLFMGLSRDQIREQAPQIAEFSGLGEFLDLPLRTYSAGMALRLLFSIATSINPDTLLMDEWIAAGDAEFRDRANQRLNDMVGRSKILVLASHNSDLLRTMCNKGLLLEAGRLGSFGRIEDVLSYYESDQKPV
jgi:ABC-type polysaccharide/polyol phosphate transport system ATPase subunit